MVALLAAYAQVGRSQAALRSSLSRRRLYALLNRVSQLRPYSYADLVVLWLALGAAPSELAGCSLLWFGFLIHLEWWHHDRGRLRWDPSTWVVAWIVAVALVPTPAVAVFFLLALGYSLKKRYRWLAAVSPLVNGGLKAALAAVVVPGAWAMIALIYGVMAFRNLMGDVRDAAKDAEEGVATVPVACGYRRATPYVYPLTLMATTLLWVLIGGLPLWVVPVAWSVEVATYPLTPR